MSEDWYDIAYINHDEAILHGTRKDDTEVRIVLSDKQRREIEDMNSDHSARMQRLLREFAA